MIYGTDDEVVLANAEELANLVIHRPANANDGPFLLNSWLKSYARHRDSLFYAQVSKETYFTKHHKAIIGLLGNSTVTMAVNKDDQEQILGWACYQNLDDKDVLHYIYVKHSLRGFGVGTGLLAYATPTEKPIEVSHITPSGLALWRANFDSTPKLDPYLVFGI